VKLLGAPGVHQNDGTYDVAFGRRSFNRNRSEAERGGAGVSVFRKERKVRTLRLFLSFFYYCLTETPSGEATTEILVKLGITSGHSFPPSIL
jgi:hypothetical protein